ncbi:MAG: hypothetical protein B6D56_00195 [Candidatus Omnitrophica bacterium 4484_70.1]|nr:MAG: hypothetical protein B6D56_00195 [Candidatus Omnitrophica bacterium 4484_70.1]
MEKVTIKGFRREKTGKQATKKLRREKFLPAIIYGKDINLPIKIPRSELKLLKEHHFSETILVEIIMADSSKIDCIIKDVQYHPLDEEVIHLDFMKVSLKEKVRVKVPLEIKGEENIKDAVVEQMMWEIEIEALPLEIPDKITVDISSLKIGDSFHVKDLRLEKIKVVSEAEDTIVTVLGKEEAVEEVSEEVEEEKEPEVIKEKKKESEEGS